MSFLYRFVLYPIAFVILQIMRPVLGKKARTMITDKNADFFEVKNQTTEWIASKKPFWIHAASGEIEYARPVIRELKKRFPDIPIIVTFSSPSAKKIIKSLADVDAWGALPWDFKSDCREFITKWNPRCLLIARTDVWPVLASVCHEMNIPSLLFSATFAENSSRLHGASAKVTTWALNQLSDIYCVSNEDVKQLERLTLQVPVHVRGDSRFDQVFYRLQHPKALKTELRPKKEHAVLVAGSTWPEDEKVVLPAFAALKNKCKLILAPHEVHESHLKSLEAELQSLGLSYCFYSNAQAWNEEQVLIIDQVGILAEIYTWGDFAFVGGSFKKQVHSVMEPLAAGLSVFVGPFHQNNREALVFKNKQIGQFNAVTTILDSEDFSSKLAKQITNPTDFRRALHHELEQHTNSSKSVVEWCARKST